jgi:hypothetical protein
MEESMTSNPDGLLPSAKEVMQKIALAEAEEAEQEARKRAEAQAPESVTIDPRRRPFVVVDPRAGHGPGIAGFKADSEIGVALKGGIPATSPAFCPILARKAVKAAWVKEGLKPQYLDASDLTTAAKAYLSEHPDLIQEAERTLAEWESSPRYRSFVESSATAQHRKPRKPRL